MTYEPGRPHRPEDGGADFAEPASSYEQRTPEAPLPPDAGRTPPGTPGTGRERTDRAPGTSPLVAPGERDKLGARFQQALSSFVDHPRRAVEEADGVVDEAIGHLTEGLKDQLRALRGHWQPEAATDDTEELRLALRQYHELTQRLLHL